MDLVKLWDITLYQHSWTILYGFPKKSVYEHEERGEVWSFKRDTDAKGTSFMPHKLRKHYKWQELPLQTGGLVKRFRPHKIWFIQNDSLKPYYKNKRTEVRGLLKPVKRWSNTQFCTSWTCEQIFTIWDTDCSVSLECSQKRQFVLEVYSTSLARKIITRLQGPYNIGEKVVKVSYDILQMDNIQQLFHISLF